MTDLRQAAQQALEALQISQDYVQASANAKLAAGWGEQLDRAEKAITALRTALGQQQAEPVALEAVYEIIIYWDEGGGKRSRRELAKRIVDFYADPPQRKPLTEAQVAALLENCIGSLPVAKQLIRAIEAAHGIKEQ